jgi:hypothetical protein
LGNRYHEIDGVEVLFAIKTPGQICFMVCGRMEFIAQRASEAQESIFIVAPNIQSQHIDDNRINGEMIS